MSNILYEDKMFNEDRKKEFMEQYGEGTKKTLARMFKITQPTETDLGIDLCDFNREQLRRVLFLFRPSTEYSSKQNVSWIAKYLDWCIFEKGYLTGTNPLNNVSKEWSTQFVNNKIKKFWTKTEIDQIINKCNNAQDAVIIALRFNGVGGEGQSEIINLTKDDVDAFNNRLHLFDNDGGKRTIEVDEKCIRLCEIAIREDVYEKMNGNASPHIRSEEANLVSNNYVVRSANTNTTHMDEAEKNIVYRRVSKIAAELKESHFNPKQISYSGMLYKAFSLLEDKEVKVLEDEDYEKIFKQFNVVGDQAAYRIKNEFLNMETLKELYPEIS